MAKNKMSDVAKLLNLELREEFKIQGMSLKYRVANVGLQYYSETEEGWVTSNKLLPILLQGEISIIKVKQPILDDIEKKYLGNIIKPFRNRIDYITKVSLSNGEEYIFIKMKNYEKISLPFFTAGTMYKGMESDKEYTLDELEL